MTIITVSRAATPDEVAAEMDRRGAVIAQLETNLRHWREECGKLHSQLDSAKAEIASLGIPAQGQNDEFGYYDLGQSFLEEYECAVKDGCLKDFVCAESPVEVIWHLINAKDQAVLDFANSILHGDDEHRGWLQEAARAFVAGHPLPPPRASAPPQESETVAVPKSALEWLFGSGPDEDGKWFGECEDIERATPRKFSHTYWWRSKFRKLIGHALRYDKVTRTIVRDTAPNHSQEATKP